MTGVWTEPALWLARGLHLAALIAAAGALAFRAGFMPGLLARLDGSAAALIRRRLDRIAMLALLAGFGTAAWWFVQVSASMAGAVQWKAILAALPPVLTETWFGEMLLLRLGLLLASAIAVAAGGDAAAALLAAAGLAVQPWFGHGAAIEGARGSLIIAAGTVHVLAAGLWLGGLGPLLVLLRAAPIPVAAAALRRFSALGIACVLALVLSAMALAVLLIGSLPGLTGTTYGRIALIKLAILVGLLGCAAVNRQVFTPALDRGKAATRRRLACSVGIETGLGFLVVVAASMLASQAPP